MRFTHRGLQRLYERGDARRLDRRFLTRIRRILTALDEATEPHQMNLPGWGLHPLRGDRAGQWSVQVSGNWRIVFRFDKGEAVDIDLTDYH